MSLVRFTIGWLAPAGAPPGADRLLLQLLEAIRVSGSIAGAAKAANVSYRHAWGTLGHWEKLLGGPVVTLQRGRGATLSPLGEQLLDAESRIHRRLEPVLARLSAEIGREFAASLGRDSSRLHIVASHDLALLQLRDLAAEKGLPIELQVRGSSESLAAYSRGECDLAGFHLVASHPDIDLRHWLDPRRDALIRFATRRQGLMVKKGNPKRIHTMTDLARASIRFVNRQPGSGTRALFDRLLADSGVTPRQIRGYSIEEYTHLAVAATIASGMADAGFGIEAASAQHGLDFVPVATEQYLLVSRKSRLKAAPIVALRRLMRAEPFREACAQLAGYDLSQAGHLARLESLAHSRPD